jgi:hypothetical protein
MQRTRGSIQENGARASLQANMHLRAGTNVLAIQILNQSAGYGDLRCAAT